MKKIHVDFSYVEADFRFFREQARYRGQYLRNGQS